ncbi:BACON domain-containing protein [Frankia sp. Cr2]|uniref:BACON domain-containing protein n=1 Tax=Frankia sp. Cr2 TaxID=3073932 RepID=UPI002AD269B6|nr:hypothetical protein [Frankia sp. Cr2]
MGAWLRFRPTGAQAAPAREPAATVAAAATGADGGVAGGAGVATTPAATAGAAPGFATGVTVGGAPSATGRLPTPGPALAVDAGIRAASPTAIVASAASLVFSPAVLDLGSVNSSATVELRNTGSLTADYQFAATPTWLAVGPSAGTVAAGGRRTVLFSLDRTAAPAGLVDISVAVAVRSGATQPAGTGAVRVTAVVSGPPVIDAVTAAPSIVYPLGCAPASGPTLSMVSVRATDSTGVFGVQLVARLPDGRTTSTALNLDSATGQQSDWSGPVGPSNSSGRLSFTVTVTDLNGLRTESAGSLEVSDCPAPTG